MDLILEALVTGIYLAVVGLIISWIADTVSKQKPRNEIYRKRTNKNHNTRLMITLFCVGFFGYFLSDFLGLDKWYCDTPVQSLGPNGYVDVWIQEIIPKNSTNIMTIY